MTTTGTRKKAHGRINGFTLVYMIYRMQFTACYSGCWKLLSLTLQFSVSLLARLKCELCARL